MQETEIALAASKAPESTRSWRTCLAASQREALVVERLNRKHRGWFCLHMVDRNPLRAHAVAVCFKGDDVAVVFDGGFRYDLPAAKLQELMNRDRRAFTLCINTDCCTELCSCYADQHAGMKSNLDGEEDLFGEESTPPELKGFHAGPIRRSETNPLEETIEPLATQPAEIPDYVANVFQPKADMPDLSKRSRERQQMLDKRKAIGESENTAEIFSSMLSETSAFAEGELKTLTELPAPEPHGIVPIVTACMKTLRKKFPFGLIWICDLPVEHS